MASLTALQEAASDDRERASLSDWIETESLHSDGTVYASLEVAAGWEDGDRTGVGRGVIGAAAVRGRRARITRRRGIAIGRLCGG